MKNPSFRRKDGFTLVELLVVIAIIAVLAGAGFAAGNAAVQKAKKTTAQATAVAIESAVNNFYTEYGSMPKDGMSADTKLDTKTDVALLKVLLGTETGTTLLNPRAIKFLSAKEGKNKKNGIIYNPAGNQVEAIYDPWGGPYYIVLDGNYDEQVTVTPTGGTAQILNGRRVAVWSEGADYNSGKKPADDVTTWGK